MKKSTITLSCLFIYSLSILNSALTFERFSNEQRKPSRLIHILMNLRHQKGQKENKFEYTKYGLTHHTKKTSDKPLDSNLIENLEILKLFGIAWSVDAKRHAKGFDLRNRNISRKINGKIQHMSSDKLNPTNKIDLEKIRRTKRSFDSISNQGGLDGFHHDNRIQRHIERLRELRRIQRLRRQRGSQTPYAIEIVLPVIQRTVNTPALEDIIVDI